MSVPKTPKSIEALFGNAIHSSLKKMFERSPLYPTVDEVIDFFINKWSLDTARDKLSTSKSDFDVKKIYLEEGITLLKNFYKKNLPWNFNVVELESRFEVILEDPENNESHTLAGIIDRIDKNPTSNIYEIIDYKTSKRMPSQDTLNQDLQLSIYNLGLLKKWPHLSPDNIKLSLYYIKHNEKIETKRNSEDLEKTKKEILTLIQEIQNLINDEKEFVPTPSALCGWCGYKKMCPMWRHLYEKSQPIADNRVPSLTDEYLHLKEQNSQNNKRLKAVQADISIFMDKQGVERVFGEDGYLTRTTQERTGHNLDKIKKILYDLGRWNEVVEKKQSTAFRATHQKKPTSPQDVALKNK